MTNYTEPSDSESKVEKESRILAMLKSMLLETYIYCLKNNSKYPAFTRDQISDYCGCSKDTIRRIEVKALRNLRSLMGL
jgi:DNA-directed RNA polymerase sigma subunit (sigma70/sigma32)